MPTQGVIDRQRVGQALIAAARTHAHDVGERLQKRFDEVLGDRASRLDVTELQLRLAGFVEKRLALLVAVDGARLAELADDSPARRRRDEALAALREQVVDLRRVVRGLLGSEREPEVLGFQGPTAESPLRLSQQAEILLETLREHRGELPAPRVSGVRLDLGPAAETLQTRLHELTAALRDVEVERRQADASKERRDDAIESFDRIVRRVAGLLKTCYVEAGLPDLARRIRLTPPHRRVASAADRKEG
jgi:hypothetical protein